MKKFHLPYVKLPTEFITLLKSNLSVVTAPSQVFDTLRTNRALYHVLETSFKEFDDGRGIEKLMMALGWPNFRERTASLFIYRSVYGQFPSKTDMDLVEDIKKMEVDYLDHGVHGYSRLFLLGLYLRLANVQISSKTDGLVEIKVPDEMRSLLKITQGRSEKIDWLILILMHLSEALGFSLVRNAISSGKKMNELYGLLANDARENMHRNLMAYGASIQEPDFFLYEKV